MGIHSSQGATSEQVVMLAQAERIFPCRNCMHAVPAVKSDMAGWWEDEEGGGVLRVARILLR